MSGETDRRFEETLAAQCAPTLAGLKPASLFCWHPAREAGQVPHWARAFAPYGIGLRTLKTCPATGRSLLYLYRGRWLRAILSEERNAAFLRARGYAPERGSGFLLRQLAERLRLEEAFPHEIGVFLGYPLEDVVGFIVNHGQNYSCCGCWKSYGDPEEAGRVFARYRRCTETYCRNVRLGISLTRLIVAA